MKKAQYSGMTTVQVGNPSFLYEEMLEDYEDSSVNPDFNWEQDEKVHRNISASNLVLRGRGTGCLADEIGLLLSLIIKIHVK